MLTFTLGVNHIYYNFTPRLPLFVSPLFNSNVVIVTEMQTVKRCPVSNWPLIDMWRLYCKLSYVALTVRWKLRWMFCTVYFSLNQIFDSALEHRGQWLCIEIQLSHLVPARYNQHVASSFLFWHLIPWLSDLLCKQTDSQLDHADAKA